nr:fatty acid amide hydrolase-like [Tanacetum cinerariifolium]
MFGATKDVTHMIFSKQLRRSRTSYSCWKCLSGKFLGNRILDYQGLGLQGKGEDIMSEMTSDDILGDTINKMESMRHLCNNILKMNSQDQEYHYFQDHTMYLLASTF